jgi:hypothetical protein
MSGKDHIDTMLVEQILEVFLQVHCSRCIALLPPDAAVHT